jgi:ribosome-associated heat shock protein Hsp15
MSERGKSEAEAEEHARLDVWLWRARFFKTRPLATEFVIRKGVRLARGGLPVRKIIKAGYSLTQGDILAFSIGGRPFHLQVLDFGSRRGPAAEAALLYHLLLDDQ